MSVAPDDETWLSAAASGRVLVTEASQPQARGIVILFHGYAGRADDMLADARPLAAAGWHLCCPEALHRFYRKGTRNEIGASWMTKHGREHDLAANHAYRARILAHCHQRWGELPVVAVGFSQGAAQAWYATTHLPLSAIIACGGQIPPECRTAAPSTPPPALILRGERDRFYTAEQRDADCARLAALNWPAETRDLPGGHAWRAHTTAAISDWLAALS
ncbi:MAG: dienelactone hydrolase family protein [Planctomycetota bacterium]|jgi:dienelactone hydrolase|nr:dienelactone hydrolase family protein [Planctomycetota bacterium]